VLILGAALFLSLGRILTAVDPLQHADAIYVLAGTRVARAAEAARLYHEGYAPRVVLSPGLAEPSEVALRSRGIRIPSEIEVAREVALQLEVPADAIVMIATPVDNTAQEVEAITSLIEEQRWTRLIVISDRASTRRVGYAFRRVFKNRVQIFVTCNHDDRYDPRRWWSTRASIRLTMYEAPKLLAYWAGLKG
jgi:uncharacterized SAM-binding protein YcdF (DUF218 family)